MSLHAGSIGFAAREEAEGTHGLSKNTFLYAGVSMSTGDLKDFIAEKTVTQAGMRPTF